MLLKRPYILVFLFGIISVHAQKNNNSLLWKITGNNLKKPSYLYGTMHVSNKIAFRLDDVFYEALDNAEYVALESDPNLWLDYYMDNKNAIDINNSTKKGFYKQSFGFEQPTQQHLAGMLAFDAQMLNSVLYRTEVVSQDFQEETYLDMFIYQTGKKFHKNFVALEDIEQAEYLVSKSKNNMLKEEPDGWLIKKLQKDSYYNLLQNAYRERNINFIDSLQKAYYTGEHLKYMLYERNKIMANGIHTTVHKGSTFVGIGAAHLAGEQGVIELLRNMGYTLTPLQSEKTKTATKLKTKFEETFTFKPYENQSIKSGFLTVDLPNKLYNFGNFRGVGFYASPDLTNGAYFSVVSLSTYPFVPKGKTFSLNDLEDMFFEFIPGTITSKKYIENNGFKGIDIINKLKNGDYQRYQIFQTPLEFLVVKLGGKKEFSLQYSDKIFNTLKLHNNTSTTWTTLSNLNKSFEVSTPNLYTFYNPENSGKKTIVAFDQETESYYVLQRSTLNDLTFIEEDNFELQIIQKRFYETLDITPEYNQPKTEGNTPYLTSTATDTTKNSIISVKTTLHNGDYYLLATFNAPEANTQQFFNSFKIKVPEYEKPFEKTADTALYFTTLTNVKPPLTSTTSYGSENYYYNSDKNNKDYESYSKENVYKNGNDELIEVTLNKFHDFEMFRNVDSLWNWVYDNYEYKSFNKKRIQSGTDKFNNPYSLGMLTDTLSNRAIYIKTILKNGTYYKLKTLINTEEEPSKFINEFYDNFEPKDTVIGVSPLTNKIPEFFEGLRKNDSVITSAIDYVIFTEKDLDSLMWYVDNFEFPELLKQVRHDFIMEIATIDHKKVKPYLKKLYLNSYEDSYTQETILQEIAADNNENAVETIMNLFAKDFPVDVSSYGFLLSFKDSTQLSKKFFPELLDYASIQEYKMPIYGMLSHLVLEKKINPKIYKSMIGQLLNEAKIELKRQFSRDNTISDDYDYYKNDYAVSSLTDYVTLLYPYRKTRKVSEFFSNLDRVKNDDFQMDFLIIKHKLVNNTIAESNFATYAKDINTRSNLFYKLQNANLIKLFPKAYFNQDSINASSFYTYENFDRKTNYHEFLGKHQITNKKGTFDVYIYKHHSKNYDNKPVVKYKSISIPAGSEVTVQFKYSFSETENTYETEEEQITNLLNKIKYADRERVNTQSKKYNNRYDNY